MRNTRLKQIISETEVLDQQIALAEEKLIKQEEAKKAKPVIKIEGNIFNAKTNGQITVGSLVISSARDNNLYMVTGFSGLENINVDIQRHTVNNAVVPINTCKLITEQQLADLQPKEPELIEQIFKMRELLNIHCGEDNYDLHAINKDFFAVNVRFPQIEVKNRYRHTHIIKDVFIRFHVKYSSKKLIKVTDLQGARASMSFLEYTTGYKHSHFSTGYNTRYPYNSMCMGKSPLGEVLAELKAEEKIDFDKFEIFLLELENYLGWESIDGGPYMRMEDIKSRDTASTPSLSSIQIADEYTNFLYHCKNLNLENKGKNIKYFQIIPDFLDTYQNMLYPILIDKVTKRPISTSNIINQQSTIENFNNKQTLLYFKGKDVPITMYPVPQQAITKEYLKRINQQAYDYIVDKLNIKINKFFAYKEWEEKINNQKV
jgi:hypothetical protein